MDREECEVDKILRKVSSSGLSSLSPEELETLKAASRFYASGGSGAFAKKEDLVDEEVPRDVAAQAHASALARGIPSGRVMELWNEAGFTFGSRQPFESELKRFLELVDGVTCDRCGQAAPRFRCSMRPKNEIMCEGCWRS